MAGGALAGESGALPDPGKKQLVYELYGEYRTEFPEVVDITPRESIEMLAAKGKIVFIDTRRPEEMQVSTLPGSITKSEFLASIDAYRDHVKIAYCTIGYRSGIFSRDMARQEVSVYNLAGGILAWTLEGGALYHDGEPVRRVHVFAERWNYAPSGFETETFNLFQQLF